MAYPFAVLKDAVRSTVAVYVPGSGSMTVASVADFPVPSPAAPILITAVVQATYAIYPESYGTYQVTGVSGDTFTGLVLVSGSDLPFVAGDVVEMRTVAQHINDLEQIFGASGVAHRPGLVPDPGSIAGAVRFLREDGVWYLPAGGEGGGGDPGGLSGDIQWNHGGVFAGFTVGGDLTIDPVTGLGLVTGTNGVPFARSATVDATNAANISSGLMAVARLPAMGASGANHSPGLVPDPPATAGAVRYLREDTSWAVPPAAMPGGLTADIQFNAGGAAFGGFTAQGDATINVVTGVVTVTATRGVAFASSATVDATNASNITAGTLPAGRLPAFGLDVYSQGGSANLTVVSTGGVFFARSATVDTTNAANITSGVMAPGRLPLFGASGAAHAPGAVPDPGPVAATARYLREDASWSAPPVAGPGGTSLQVQYHDTGGGFSGFTVGGDGTLSVFNGLLLVTSTNGVPFAPSATVDATNAANITTGVMALARLPVMVGSGANHAPGIVPDPGATAGGSRYLREDGQWIAPPSGGGGSPPGGVVGSYQVNLGSGSFGGVTISGDLTLSATGVGLVTGTNGVPFAPSATVDTTNAVNITSGRLASTQMPFPGSTTLGGVMAGGFTANQWVFGISGIGALVTSQPAFTNISGTVAPGQLPAPTATTLGGVQAKAAAPNQWLSAIGTDGVPVASQPFFASVGGQASLAQLPTIGSMTGLVNATAGAAQPAAVSLSAWNDAAIGAAQGTIAYRAASGWLGAVQVLRGTGLITSAYTAVPGDRVQADTASGPVTITLPTAPPDHTMVAVTHLVQGGANAVTVACGGADTIFILNQPTSIFLPYQGQTVVLEYQSAGGIWYIVNSDSNTRNTGDYVSSSVPNTAVNLATNVPVNVTSISLVPGDWDISGLGYFSATAATFAAANAFSVGPGTTTNGWLADATALYPIFGTGLTIVANLPFSAVRVLVTTTTTYYFVVRSIFSAGTVTAGGIIRARRYR